MVKSQGTTRCKVRASRVSEIKFYTSLKFVSFCSRLSDCKLNMWRRLFMSLSRVKEVLANKSLPTDDCQTANSVVSDDRAETLPPAQIKKTDVELLRDNEEKFRFCPKEDNMNKCLEDLPTFTYNTIVRYVQTSGKNIQSAPDYMVMKPFERGVSFFIEGYLHNVLAKRHQESKTFYFRARCYRSLRKSEAPHKIRLALATEQPYDVQAASCSCVAGSLPHDLVCTSLPQQWHKPRGRNISSEP